MKFKQLTSEKSYSQFGEDKEILRFFQNNLTGYYVEVGANDGIHNSNTLLLEKKGWKGLLIEANPDLIAKAIHSRPNSIVLNYAVVAPNQVGSIEFYQVVGGDPNLSGLSTIVGDQTFISRINSYGADVKVVGVPANTLDDILKRNNTPHNFEFLSIDVEGAELEVLKGLSLNVYNPRVILAEDNSFGADLSVRNYLKQYGFLRVHRTGVNDWYVKVEDSKYFFKENVILNLRFFKWWFMRSFLPKK